MSETNETPIESLESLRRRYHPALAAAAEKAISQVERINWESIGPMEFIRLLEHLITLDRLFLGFPMTADQVKYHLGPEQPVPLASSE